MDSNQVPFVTQVKMEDSNQQIQTGKAEPDATEGKGGNERGVKQEEAEVQIILRHRDGQQ